MRIGLLLGCALAAALALAVPASGSHPAGAPAAPTGVLPPLPPSPAPSITGTAQAGSTLTGHDGGWEAGATLSRQWLRCDAAGAGCVFLHDTDLTHTLADADVGKRIRLRVRATTVSGTREVDSAPTAPVAGQKPSSLASPTVEGKLREGEIILSAPGVWLGTEPLAFSNRWAGLLPFRINASSRSRSSSLSRTTYFFTEISFAAMIVSVVRGPTKTNH